MEVKLGVRLHLRKGGLEGLEGGLQGLEGKLEGLEGWLQGLKGLREDLTEAVDEARPRRWLMLWG